MVVPTPGSTENKISSADWSTGDCEQKKPPHATASRAGSRTTDVSASAPSRNLMTHLQRRGTEPVQVRKTHAKPVRGVMPVIAASRRGRHQKTAAPAPIANSSQQAGGPYSGGHLG